MRIRALSAVSFLLCAIAPAIAFAQQLAVFDPPRVAGAPGGMVMVRATPVNVPEHVRKVFIGVDPSSVAGRLHVTDGPVDYSVRGPSGEFMTVRIRMRIAPNASGDIPVAVKVLHLTEHEQPDRSKAMTMPNAFVVSVGGGAAPSMPGTSHPPTAPPLPQRPAPAPAPPLPTGPVTTSYVTPELAAQAQKVDRETQHLDGFADTLKNAREEGVPAEIAAAQGAFLQLNDQIIQQLRNPVGLIGTNELGEPKMDPQLLADFIAASGIFERDAERREALAQIAALGGPGALPIINYEAEIDPPRLGQPVRWSEYSSIEALLIKILLRRIAEGMQPGTEKMREAMEKINEGIEKLGGEDAESLKKIKWAFRPLALAGSLITIADVAGKAVLALTPSEITQFYALINDTPRQPNDPPVVINEGQEIPIKVFIHTRAPGGQIVTPSEVAGWIWDNMPEKTKEKITERVKFPETKVQVRDDVKKWLTERVTSNPTVKAWIESANKLFDIPPFEGTPVEANSTRVIEMSSRDTSRLDVVARQEGRYKRFYLRGIRETPVGEAGYQFGMRPSTWAALKDADKTKFGLNNIRGNVTVQKQLSCNDTGKSCVPTKAEEADSEAQFTPEGAMWWKLVCGTNVRLQDGSVARQAGPCQCKCSFLIPR